MADRFKRRRRGRKARLKVFKFQGQRYLATAQPVKDRQGGTENLVRITDENNVVCATYQMPWTVHKVIQAFYNDLEYVP